MWQPHQNTEIVAWYRLPLENQAHIAQIQLARPEVQQTMGLGICERGENSVIAQTEILQKYHV
jgi:hypothetical protein